MEYQSGLSRGFILLRFPQFHTLNKSKNVKCEVNTARKVEFHGIGLMTEIYSKCDILAMCLMS